MRLNKICVLPTAVVLLFIASVDGAATFRNSFTSPSFKFALPTDMGMKSVAFLKGTTRDTFQYSLSSLKKLFTRPSTNLVTTLQDKIIELERQIRASKEESRQLRALLNAQRNKSRRNRSDDVRRSAEVERVLSDQMENLRQRIEELSQSKGEMEQLLKQEKDYVKRLEKMLREEKESRVAIFEQHAAELEELRNQALLKSDEQMKKVEKDLVAKMKLEIERIQKEADALVAKERARSKALEKERDEFRDVAENERVKMRKLVKVLAEREKREIAMSQSMGNDVPPTPTIISSSASGMNNGNTKRKVQNLPNPLVNPKK